ncbi:hypothetical protein EDC96DRAFT_545522 [Choanephora cucurbitarum]|nr:hypothetical protein EDC96DRAFT_545522 [Choanephora cucurbitarum]
MLIYHANGRNSERNEVSRKILDIEYWMLDIGYWILDIGYWILDTKHGRTVDIIVFSSLDRAILVRVEMKRTKRSERKTCWMIVVEDPSLLALNGSLKSRRCWESIFDEFKHASYITATQSHVFTSVSDMDLVPGLTCSSEFASSLFHISNMFVIVKQEGREDCLFEPHSYQYERL